MNIEGEISMSAPSIGPAISGPAFGPSFGGLQAPSVEIGPIMSSPSFSFVNEGPAPVGSFADFSPLVAQTPDFGGKIGPIEVLNSTFPIIEPQPMVNIFNEGPVPASFLEQTRPITPADFSYNPRPLIGMSQPMPLIEVAPRTSVFEPSRVEFGRPKIIELVMPEIGVVQPVVEPQPDEDEEEEAELERVRKTISGLKNDLQEATENFEAVSVKVQPQLQTESMKMILKLVENKEEKRSLSNKEKEGVEVSKNKLVRDEKALAQRLQDALKAVRIAFEQAKTKGKDTVSGKEVKTFIPDEYSSVRSGVLKQDEIDYMPDGSYLYEDVGIKQIKVVSSEQEMQSRVREVVNNNVPVIRSQSEGGEPVTPEDVEKVYLFRKSPPIEQTSITYQKAA